MLPLALTVAIVVADHVALRAAPRESAPRQAVEWKGDWLEVRGERAGFVEVYDHRRERPGYVWSPLVRRYQLDEPSAPALASVLDFLQGTPGEESLGIGYAALYLKAAPAGAALTRVFDALGAMADRLAQRASSRSAGPGDATLAAELEVAESWGVKFTRRVEADRTRVCYDGEAFRRVLAMGGDPDERARAALALTRPECVDPALGPVEKQALDEWRLSVLDQADPSRVAAWLGDRLHLRRATVAAGLVYPNARRGTRNVAQAASERAIRELALVDKNELLEEDAAFYDEVATRVGAARWAAEPESASLPSSGPIRLELAAGQPGETCVRLVDGKAPGSPTTELARRCTWGQPWPASIARLPSGAGFALVVQTLPSWTELWLVHPVGGAWRVDTLQPATTDPDAGYVELAGATPDGTRLLVVKEALVAGAAHREFAVVRRDTLAVEKSARSPDKLVAFRRWQSALWKGRTIALR